MKNITPEDKRIAVLAAEFDKEREQNPYVTLQAVIDAIALHVEISTSELEQYAWPPLVNMRKIDPMLTEEKKANTNQLRRFLQYSRAARRLHKLFVEDATEIKWYDFNHESTNIIATNEAKDRGLKSLASAAGAERQFCRAWEKAEARLRLAQQSQSIVIAHPAHELHKEPETELIGFNYFDVVNELDTYEITHDQPYRSLTYPNWRSDFEQPVPQITRGTKTPPDGIDRFPNTKEIVVAIDGLLGKTKSQWRNMLKSPKEGTWLDKARVQSGGPGTDGATWDPLDIAQTLFAGVTVETDRGGGRDNSTPRYVTKKEDLDTLDKVFAEKLPEWKSAWDDRRASLESYIT